MSETNRILFVDDEPMLLDSIRRTLRKKFKLETAVGPNEGLKALSEKGPFAVVVSDMRMPEMDGVEFLCEVQRRDPDAVRVMLTGNSDQQTAMEAINKGNVFRFVNKPVDDDQLSNVLKSAIRHHRLITAEKTLLSRTLTGSVAVLSDILALAKPEVFGRTEFIRGIVSKMCKELNVEQPWRIELAASLGRLGYIGIPDNVLAAVVQGEELDRRGRVAMRNHPETGARLVSKIPRLESVSEIIALQNRGYDGSGSPTGGPTGSEIPIGARILKVVHDYDQAVQTTDNPAAALELLWARQAEYDSSLLPVLEAIVEDSFTRVEINLVALEEGMILDDNVTTTDGDVLLAKDQTLTDVMIERLKGFASHRTVLEPIGVRVMEERVPELTAAE